MRVARVWALPRPRARTLSIASFTPATHPAFDMLRSSPVPEHAAHATLYRHRDTGAEMLSVSCAETEKVFGVALATPPGDDTGVAHVLEHSVLCGSRLYPSKEPFVTLLASSMQTFLNAMTYPDRTVYVVASPHSQDFKNLCRVYLDAVLFPRLGAGVLSQEGWHFEPVEGEGKQLRVSGVVLNEMKGVYSSPDSVHAMACDAALFPQTLYSRSSGGDPLAITALTPTRFEAFHAENYAPEKGRFFFFGDDDVSHRLSLLDEFLKPFGEVTRATPTRTAMHPRAITLQTPFTEPRHVLLPYPAGGEGGVEETSVATTSTLERPLDPLQWDAPVATRDGYDAMRTPPTPSDVSSSAPGDHYVTLNWCVGTGMMPSCGSGGSGGSGGVVLDEVTRLGLGVLSHLLMGTQTSTLRKALTDSRLGSAVTGGGLDDGSAQPTFSAGLKGVRGNDAHMVEALTLHTLTLAAADGFTPEHCAASFNTIEFALREFASGGGPRGVSLFLGVASGWLLGRDPIRELGYAAPLDALKAAVAALPPTGPQSYFAGLVRTYLLLNPHRATVQLWPDAQWASRREGAEAAWLRARAEAMTDEDFAAVRASAAALKRAQETPDAPEVLAKIPTLRLSDMARHAARPLGLATVERLPSPHTSSAPRILATREEATAGIGYIRLAIDASPLPTLLMPLLPLFAWATTSTGTRSHDETAMSQRVGSLTGGVSVSAGVGDVAGFTSDLATPRLLIAGKALSGRGDALGDILHEFLTSAQLDNRGRITTHLRERVASAEAALSSSGHAFAGGLLAAPLSKSAWVRDCWGGLTALRVARTLLHRIDTGEEGGFDALVADLSSIRECLVTHASHAPEVGGAALAALPSGPYPALLASAIGDATTLPEFSAAVCALTGHLQAAPPPTLPPLNPACALASGWSPPTPHASLPRGSLPLWPYPLTEEEADCASRIPGTGFGVTAQALREGPHTDFALLLPSSSVNFVVRAGRVIEAPPLASAAAATPAPYAVPQPLHTTPLAPAASGVVSNMLRVGYLWDRVRVQGGAYGAGASLSRSSGVLSFHSYRDPHIDATLRHYAGVGAALREVGWEGGSVLDKAIISTLGGVDAPLSPIERGDAAIARWANGGSESREQEARESILGAGRGDLDAFGAAADAVAGGRGRTAVAGGAAVGTWAAGGGRVLVVKPVGGS